MRKIFYNNEFDERENQEFDEASPNPLSTGLVVVIKLGSFSPTKNNPRTRYQRRDQRSIQNTYRGRNQQPEQNNTFQSTSQEGSSCISMLITLAIIVAVIITLASCSDDTNSSANSDMLFTQETNVGSNTDINTSDVSNVAYQTNEQILPAEEDLKETDQAHQPISDRTYVVKPGDTLYSIAAKMLGNGNRWTEIDQLNNLGRLANGSVLIHPGQELILPDY